MAIQTVILENVACSNYSWLNMDSSSYERGSNPMSGTNVFSSLTNYGSSIPSNYASIPTLYDFTNWAVKMSRSHYTSGGIRDNVSFCIWDKQNNTQLFGDLNTIVLDTYTITDGNVFFAFGIDETTQKAYFAVSAYPNYNVWNWKILQMTTNHAQASRFYTLLKEEIPPSYNWQSVPSISGKNGILSLPVLIDTDGNPVTNGSINDFSTFPAEAKVRTLANANI